MIGFPSRQFGRQEGKTAEEILDFVEGYGVKFPLTELCDINGANAHPVWTFLKENNINGNGKDVRWNFATKFLVDRQGKITRYDGVNPLDMEDDIVRALKASEL